MAPSSSWNLAIVVSSRCCFQFVAAQRGQRRQPLNGFGDRHSELVRQRCQLDGIAVRVLHRRERRVQQAIHDLEVGLADFKVVVDQFVARQQPLRPPTFAHVDDRNVPRRRNHPWASADHDAPAASRDDPREEHIADVQRARGALFEHMESLSGQDISDIERSPNDNRFDDEEACRALASLQDELAVQLRSRLDLMEELQRERLGRPPLWQRVLRDIRYEVDDKERIECGSKLLGVLDVSRRIVPQEELVPGFVEEFAAKFLRRVGEQSRHERTLGRAQPNAQAIFAVLDTKAAVLELTAATARTRIVTTDRRHRRRLSRALFLRELVYALVRQPQETGSVARAHLQSSGSQHTDGATSGEGCSAVFFVGFLAKRRVSANGPCGGTRQLHVVHDWSPTRIVNEQFQRLPDPAPSLVDSAALCVTAAHPAHRSHPPPRLISLVGHVVTLHGFFNHPFPRHGSKSRSMRRRRPGPMSSPAWTGTVVTQ
jgi:hypothetical protein